MPGVDEIRCPRCGRRARALDLTATSITCADCDPAWDAVRNGNPPGFGGGGDGAVEPPALDEDEPSAPPAG